VREQVGKPYSWGGVGPNSFDCSGLVQTGLSTVGVHVQRTAAQQSATAGVYESISDAQPGDLLFWNGVGSSGHVAVYIGGGMFIGAQNESTGVAVVSLSWDRPLFARRVL
jgi:cell wall-associated NlpC family hydrolase